MDKGVVSCGNHCGGIAMHEKLDSDVDILEHIVTAPAAYEVGPVLV